MKGLREYLKAYWSAGIAFYKQGKVLASTILIFLASGYVSWQVPSWLGAAIVVTYLGIGLFVILPYRMWKTQRGAIAGLSKPIPDMPIKELFEYASTDVAHLDPEVEDWRVLGRQLLDRLSTEQLGIWGRSREGKDAPLRSIDPAYWEKAEFTNFFLLDEPGLVHTRTLFDILSDEKYYDLHLNRAQVEQHWPKR